jgi:hypothetical protein
MKRAVAIVLVLLLGVVSPALAAESPLRVEPLGDNVYAVIGPSGDRSAENLGNNANFGFVVTPGAWSWSTPAAAGRAPR